MEDGGQMFKEYRSFIPNTSAKTFKDCLMGNPTGEIRDEKVVEVSNFEKPFDEWMNKTLIVRVIGLSTLVKLDKLFSVGEGMKVDLKYVGGLYMLVLFESFEGMVFFKDVNSNAKVWFSWIKVWVGQALPFERIAWLKITGVPIHLLDSEVFDSVGRFYGKVVHASSMSYEATDLTFDLVGVLVWEGDRINDSVSLRWKDRKFKVWVTEEQGDWVSDYMCTPDSWDKKDTIFDDLEQSFSARDGD
ncbi:hypothetical protein HanXRQr2_Chr03g0092811 [Helianthus annuus]|uniref:DUF4283 domain-containing protein n=1 Tax=Helianthus annuus TaxID=4232 RepID=A0A9K3NTU1_HELAN|nr:hypothetical protein HanXRQr2_Chr03g0092811 [Helianthus annuus]KAJ0606770.1 hypothetical protein HanHA89_Chr03g0088891 [Helianthus annuus]KAJ0766830.1 hypothetical protein HanLR1_Chr03g0082071 [Helianthus annuus]